MIASAPQLGHFRLAERKRYLLSMVEQDPTPLPMYWPVTMLVISHRTRYSRWPLGMSVWMMLNFGASLKVRDSFSAPGLRRAGLSPHPGTLPKCSPSFMTDFITC
jgi:hypothetical protein